MDSTEKIAYLLRQGVSCSFYTSKETLTREGRSWESFNVKIWDGDGVNWSTRSSPNEALTYAVNFVSRINVLTDEDLIVLAFFKVQPSIGSVYRVVRIARKHYALHTEFASAMMYAIGTKGRHWDSTYVEGTIYDLKNRGYICDEKLTKKGERFLKELLPAKLHEWHVKYLTKEFDESALPADQVRTF